MCIRDSIYSDEYCGGISNGKELKAVVAGGSSVPILPKDLICLLYTSDAADERSSVDLGGRRIIKQKINTLRP